MSEKNKIDGRSKSIKEILSNARYGIDYYQREYKWRSQDIEALISDLSGKFESVVDTELGRASVQNYRHYFLGSFVVSVKDGKKFIIDGQQRLTSITLLLIYLRNLTKNRWIKDVTNLDALIYSEAYGEKSFNIDAPERRWIVESLFAGKEDVPLLDDAPQSVRTILDRYRDIAEVFPESLIWENGEILPYFVDWLIENVDLVEITAYSDDDAYTIFETMNDRGLSLTATDMLKGYVLANIKDEPKRESANTLWKEQIVKLISLEKNEDEEFFKKWFRAKYAKTVRERKQGSTNQDYEKIGTAFHKWVRENGEKELSLVRSDDYFRFVDEQFRFFSELYLKIQKAKSVLDPKYPSVFYNHYHTFPFQDVIMLSAVKYGDNEETINKKLKLISEFLEMFIILRLTNYRSLGSSAISYSMFLLTRLVRDCSLTELVWVCQNYIKEMNEDFSGIIHYGLTAGQRNYNVMKFLLARITQYIEEKSGIPSTVEQYLSMSIKKPYEIEHITANKFERYADEYGDEHVFQEWRNSIGDLLLLPRGYNQSFNDDPYEAKVKHYVSQNLLAWSLNPQCYEKHPAFLQFISSEGFEFESYQSFGKEAILARAELIKKICEQIWNDSIFEI